MKTTAKHAVCKNSHTAANTGQLKTGIYEVRTEGSQLFKR